MLRNRTAYVNLMYTMTLSSTLVGNTQIKLTLREYNLQRYSCQLNLIYKRLNVFTSFGNQMPIHAQFSFFIKTWELENSLGDAFLCGRAGSRTQVLPNYLIRVNIFCNILLIRQNIVFKLVFRRSKTLLYVLWLATSLNTFKCLKTLYLCLNHKQWCTDSKVLVRCFYNIFDSV